ncbi:MAG: hypothetical protein E7437_00690 [Ruminococcaceae bacterium]|nr:hypothetical protein [Oscillospiraceae bacterium]
MRRVPVFYSAVMLTAVNLLLKLASTGFQVYLSGRIGPAGIGLMQLVLSVGGLSLTVGIAGIRTATMYLSAEELGRGQPQNIPWVLRGCFGYCILFSGIAALGLYLFAPTLARIWIADPRTASALRLFAGFLPVSCLCGVMTGYFTAAGRIGTLAAVEVAEQALSMTATSILLSLGGSQGSDRACMSVILGSGMGSCLTLLSLMLLAKPKKAGPRIPVRKRLASTALPLAVADDLKTGLTTLENLTVPKRLALYPGSSQPLADFGLVCGMVFPVMMFPAAILYALAELLIPEFARCSAAGSVRRIRYLSARSLKVALLYGCFMGGGMFLCAGELCLTLYDNPDAGAQLRLYAVLVPMLYCDAITDATNKGLGLQKTCMRYNILTAAMDLGGLFILLPKFGMEGYFISFSISHLVNFWLSVRLLLKTTGRSWHIKIPATALLCTGICVYMAGFIHQVYLRVGCFALLLFCLWTIAGLVGKQDLLWIRGMVSGQKA